MLPSLYFSVSCLYGSTSSTQTINRHFELENYPGSQLGKAKCYGLLVKPFQDPSSGSDIADRGVEITLRLVNRGLLSYDEALGHRLYFLALRLQRLRPLPFLSEEEH